MKAIKTSFFIIIGGIFLLYLGGVFLFSNYFLPATTINGHDFSLTKISELRKNYDKISENYKIDIVGREKTETIKGADISYKDELNSTDFYQNPFYWFLSMLVPKDIELSHKVDYDETELKRKIESLSQFQNMKKPVDAHVDYVGDKFMVIKEDKGNFVDMGRLVSLVRSKIDAGENKFNIEENKLYMEPMLYENNEDLIKAKDTYNKLSGNEIVFKIGLAEEKLQGLELAGMYKFDGEKLVADEEKSFDFAKELSHKYDTFKKDRTFYATGLGLTVVKGGIYGWLTDIEETKKVLVEALNSFESKHLEPIYKLTAMSRDGSDIGRSYIEIDLGRQHAWYYEEGKLAIDFDIVSGNPTTGNSTPTGTGRVWSREKDRFLTGEDYKSHVDFWMPFNWSGCGLHDASWRSEFGGKLYLTKGSHGCVNTPPPKMKELFEKVKVGTPVVVYDSSAPDFKTIK